MKLHKNYVPELDGLKGLAVLLIVAYSCYSALLSFELIMPIDQGLDHWVQAILKSSWIGLDLFMVIAGFLSTCELRVDQPVTTYFGRRWRRILPAYFLFVVTWLASALLFNPNVVQFEDLPSWVSVMTLTTNVLVAKEGLFRLPPHFIHLWSIALLVQFYILWPFFIRILGAGGRALWVCIGLIVLLPLARGVMIQVDDTLSMATFVVPFLRLDSFAWGAVLALMGERMTKSGWVLVGGILSLIMLGSYWFYAGGLNFQDPVILSAGLTWIAIWGVSLLSSLLPMDSKAESRANPVANFLGLAMLQTLGKYSLMIFLVHQPIVLLFVFWAYLPGPGWSPFVVFYALSLVVSLFLAVLSFHFWERRFIAS